MNRPLDEQQLQLLARPHQKRHRSFERVRGALAGRRWTRLQYSPQSNQSGIVHVHSLPSRLSNLGACCRSAFGGSIDLGDHSMLDFAEPFATYTAPNQPFLIQADGITLAPVCEQLG